MFKFIIAFGQKDLQPSILGPLLADAHLYWYIHAKPMISVLANHQGAGAHTDIYLFHNTGGITHYTWSHPRNQPFGNAVPIQCPKCYVIKPWVKCRDVVLQNELFAVTLRCSYCQKQLKRFERGRMTRTSKGKMVKSARGDWYVETW